MKVDIQYLRRYLCTTVALLCFWTCYAGAGNALCYVPETSCASYCEEEPAMPCPLHETGQWAIPSALGNVQGTIGRTLTPGKTLQRTNRLYSVSQAIAPAHSQLVAATLCPALSVKRFLSGYYLYYRCQMRC